MVDAAAQFLRAIEYLPEDQQVKIGIALEKAIVWHKDQKRSSGIPYVVHPIEVAHFLALRSADMETLIAALLHDVLEDTKILAEEIEHQFGSVVAKLVIGVTKLTDAEFQGERSDRQIYSLRKLLLTASGDIRVILIKIADRLHNINTISALNAEKQMRICKETLDIYVPFARLVGWWELKSALETICFPLAMPDLAKKWHHLIKQHRQLLKEHRQNFVNTFNKENEPLFQARIFEMTDYNVYTKLQGNVNRLTETNTLDSILITIHQERENQNILECYKVLGIIHSLYKISSGSFHDYMSTPKPNGYRALHTDIFLGNEDKVRVRIQTDLMYEYAANRNISHWVGNRNDDVYRALESLFNSPSSSAAYMKDVNDNVLNQRINVFTINGEVIVLPAKATGVDFAFAIDPDSLNYLVGIRVNGNHMEPTHSLKDGDTVDLDLANTIVKNHTLWMDRVKSVDVKMRLRTLIARQPHTKRIIMGRDLLNYELHKRLLPLWPIDHSSSVRLLLFKKFNLNSFDELLDELANGSIAVQSVVDDYKEMLLDPPFWIIRILSFFRLLPHSRRLSVSAKIIALDVYAKDRPGLIYEITRCFAEREINIASFGVFAVPPTTALYKIKLELSDFTLFSELFDALSQVAGVYNILRKY